MADLKRHATALLGAISGVLSGMGCAQKAEPAAHTVVELPSQGEPQGDTGESEVWAADSTATVTVTLESVPSASAEPVSSAQVPPPLPPLAVPPIGPQPPQPSQWPPGMVEGRPFTVERVARVAEVAPGNGWALGNDWGAATLLDGAAPTAREREALVEHYTLWALAEHASIASFARFTLHLMALGAPADLVARAVAAGADEVRHARVGFGLVEAFSGEALAPGALGMEGALGEVTLEEALRLAVREGMIGETIGALELRAAVDITESRALRETLVGIAEDESRHAELAYAFGAWAVQREPRLVEAVREEVALWRAPELPRRRGLERWGILDAPLRREVHEGALAGVVRPALRQLVTPSA